MPVQAAAQGHNVLITADNLQKRVGEIARKISQDYSGKTVLAVCVMESAFVFMADLIRELDVPTICQFVRPDFKEIAQGDSTATEIFYRPEVDVKDHDVLLVQAIVDSGITTEFLMRNLLARGAKSVKLAVLLDRQAARTISLQPDYFGFLIDESYVFGYGLGSPEFGRNLPYIASFSRAWASDRNQQQGAENKC